MCIDEQIQKNLELNFINTRDALTAAISNCKGLISAHANAQCRAKNPSESKSRKFYCVDRPDISTKIETEQLFAENLPRFLQQRTETRPDGIRHLYEFVKPFIFAVLPSFDESHLKAATQGSAVAVSDRYLVTNCHVVGSASEVVLIGSGQKLRATVNKPRRELDICLLYSQTELQVFAKTAAFASVPIGRTVYAVGMPRAEILGLDPTISVGIVSGKKLSDEVPLLQTTAPISPGSSGGGLFDSSGHLIGITTFTVTGTQNINFAIAAETWLDVLCVETFRMQGRPSECHGIAAKPEKFDLYVEP